MTFFDAVVFIILVLFLARGIWVGLVRQLAFLTALLLGFAAAGSFYGEAADWLSPVISQPQLAFAATYLLLFLPVYLLMMLLGLGLRKVMTISMLGWFDRLMGGLFGAGKAVFVASLLFMGLAGLIADSKAFLGKSLCYPLLSRSSCFILTFVRDHDLRTRFLPREPAISDLLTSSVPAGQPAGGAAEKMAQEHSLVQ